MAEAGRGPYNRSVHIGNLNRFVRAATAALFVFACACGVARADSGTDLSFPVAPAPVVRLQMRAGTLIVHMWNQSTVRISSTQTVNAQRFQPAAIQRALRGGDIPIFATTVQSPSGPVELPSEEFTVNSLSTGTHDGVNIFGGDNNATITLTVPNDTALLWASVGHGRIQMQDYRGGSFVTRVRNGSFDAQNVSGDAFIEVAHGQLQARDSSFDQVRARTAVGRILFQRVSARQIEVSSIHGNIVYDDGSFGPGVASFQSQKGDVALGINGGAQVSAHSAGGKILESFDRPAQLRGGDTDAQAVVNGGGPVVTATSQSGNVYLYNGSFASQPQLQRKWRPLSRAINRRGQQPQPHPLQQKTP